MLPNPALPDSRPLRALLVDDDHFSRLLLSRLLSQHGMAVVDVADAEAALAQVQKKPFDLILLDLVMPGMSGTELCQTLRDDLGLVDVPIIGVTAHNDVTHVALMRMTGFTDYLFKPIQARELQRILETVLAEA